MNESQDSNSTVTELAIDPTHPVAVILPVYRNLVMTKRCILAAMPGILDLPNAYIVAINDASPDYGMQEMLEELSAQWPNILLILRNEKNLGFVGTVNRGLAYFSTHDAVLLNSDVIVPKDWLSRLINEAYSRADIGTVTPFSNNATICSFPHFLQENCQPFNLDVDSIDGVFKLAKLPCITAPTGVGFCMYIRRSCLDEIGYLNEEKFGKGYGEENDFCQRAIKQGWLNIITPNIYAYHEGGVSFSSDKQALINRAMLVLDSLHPNYHEDVRLFIRNDPLKLARITRFTNLLSTISAPKVLHISHKLGGGIGQHVEELAHYYNQKLANILLTPFSKNGAICISLSIGQPSDRLIFNIPSEYDDMLVFLKALGVSAVHFHHTLDLNPQILSLPNDLGVAYILTVHDFYWLNGNPTLTDETGKFPGFYTDTSHNPLYPLPSGVTPIIWREALRTFIENADCVLYPSNATKTLFENTFKPHKTIVTPHIEMQCDVTVQPHSFPRKESYILGVLGAIGREKGADALEEISIQAKTSNTPLKFKLIGHAYRKLKTVESTGKYGSNKLVTLIQQHKLDIIFFPAQWPETYSYTLSYALNSGLPIIAPNIGAFPERLSGRKNTLLFKHLTPTDELLNQIIIFVDELAKGDPVTAPIFKAPESLTDFYTSDYISIVSRNLHTHRVDESMYFMINLTAIITRSLNHDISVRETRHHMILRIFKNPIIRLLGHTIPYDIRLAIKNNARLALKRLFAH